MRTLLLVALLVGCGGVPPVPPASVAWSPWSAVTFARAAAEGRYILVDAVAAWCHWCHVMEATTYRDPAVVALLAERFVAIQVDVDARPDIHDRYAAWGWPATILLGPDGHEIGKYKGYLEPAELLAILRAVRPATAAPPRPGADVPPPVEALPWIAARALADLDALYDRRQGSWGRQKRAIGVNLDVELRRAAHGDAAALARARATFERQRALLDPVWGGLYQYSVGGVWTRPHFEKLMTVQAPAIEATAHAFTQTGDAALRADAERILAYLLGFLRGDDDLYAASQDADVGAHDPAVPFVDGHDYFPLDDAGRRALGLPRIDRAPQAFSTGLAIAALVEAARAFEEPRYLDAARRAADAVAARLLGPDGSVRRETAHGRQVRYLADAVAYGRGLVRLAAATGDAAFADRALAVAQAIERDFALPDGGLLAHTPDPDAAGVFARPEVPLRHAATAARFYAGLAALRGDEAWRTRGARHLAAAATPAAVADEGRMIGGFVLAVDELGLLPWPDAAPRD